MRTGMLIAALTMMLSSCTTPESLGEGRAAQGYGGDFRAGSYRAAERAALRVRKDEARNRVWLLTPDGVQVYDSATKQLLRAVELPRWSTARIACHPDLALDAGGSAIVSSNAQPTLWRIDGRDFTITMRDIRLEEREQWDVGFGAMAYTADGALLASTHEGGTLWRVDFEKSSAHIVLAQGTRTCTLASRGGL